MSHVQRWYYYVEYKKHEHENLDYSKNVLFV
jgi:hypothetical protein